MIKSRIEKALNMITVVSSSKGTIQEDWKQVLLGVMCVLLLNSALEL